jgi:hypothetical protein
MSSEQMKANGSLLHNKQHPLHACMQKPLVNQVSHGDPLHLHNHNAEASQETLTSISIQHSVDPSYMRCRASLRYSYSVVLLSSWKLPTDRLNNFTPHSTERKEVPPQRFSASFHDPSPCGHPILIRLKPENPVSFCFMHCP